MTKLRYVTDSFLDEFSTNFESNYLHLYTNEKKSDILELFSTQDNVIETSKTFEYRPLLLESHTPEAAKKNIRIIWESLSHLTISEAESEKLWVVLANTVYLDYHLDQLKLISGKNRERSYKSRTVFTQGSKRSLMMNNLSLLWWIAYYTHDKNNAIDPFYYADYFVDGTYRGNALAYFSSNFVSNKNIALGTLEAIKELVESKRMKENRYSYSNANKLLNQIGGVKMLDMLSRTEIKNIIKDNLLDTENIQFY